MASTASGPRARGIAAGELVKPLGIAGGSDHPVAGAEGCFSQRPPEPGGRTGDQPHPVVTV
jgi:hypothetical protein